MDAGIQFVQHRRVDAGAAAVRQRAVVEIRLRRADGRSAPAVHEPFGQHRHGICLYLRLTRADKQDREKVPHAGKRRDHGRNAVDRRVLRLRRDGPPDAHCRDGRDEPHLGHAATTDLRRVQITAFRRRAGYKKGGQFP